MNTGIQDVHNLAWKIASIVKGIAPSSLLETYETERKPVLLFSLHLYFGSCDNFILNLNESLTSIAHHHQIAIFNTALSVQNYRAAMAVPAALGLDPTVANSGKPTHLIALKNIFSC
jgi:hypothetical protein